jgi:mono/diheme cytochrome c family protein/glucose/arabinose dehydrogenase
MNLSRSLPLAAVFLALPFARADLDGITRGIIDPGKSDRPDDAIQLVGGDGYKLVPEQGGETRWKFEDGVLTASPLWDSLVTEDDYQDFRMHLEFNVNEKKNSKNPEGDGNSGIYIQQRYEIQILNSFGVSEEDYKASYAGSLYKLKKPDRLVSKPAGEWQSYDIVFRAARFDGDEKTEDARITVYHNGQLIHDDFPIPRKTGAGKKEGPEPGPIKLQGHHNPVRFRNVWIQKLDLDEKKDPPEAKAKKKMKKGYTYAVPFDEIPPAPALSPADALKTFELHEDFEIELAASDPQVQSPVAMRFDADGRLWVVEMRAYMLNAEAEGEDKPIGRISILTDTDGDGVFEDYQVFMDGLNQPRSIAFYKDGILYAGHETLYYVENLDGGPGKMTVIDENYAGKGNVEHRGNGLLRGLDNWIYNAKSDARYREIDGEWVKELTDFRGQWGISQNNYGRLFFNQNWFGMKADQLLPNLLRRNPNFPKPFGDTANISYRDKLYPARITPGVNRGGEGAIDDDGYLTAVTAACGPVYYRGDQFPPAYRDTAFFCEPAAHLVRILKVREDDGLLSGEHPLESEEREFLASTDERFRPVYLANAPDGSLFLVDLYHGIVQHKAYLTRYLREHIEHRNLESHPRLGRIYRIKYKERPLGETPRLREKGAVELVPYLAHANGWWRDTAQQLIVDRGNPAAVSPLTELAGDTGKPLGQIHALWTLEGLGAVNLPAVAGALRSDDPHVLEMAIRLSEELSSGEAAELLPRLKELADRPEAVVRRQLAASLGSVPGDEALGLLREVVLADIDRPYFREAAIHGLAGRERRFREILAGADAKLDGYLEEALRVKTTASAHPLPKNKDHRASFDRGEKFYVTHCMACHGPGGEGIESLGPPLVDSEWVTGSPERLSAILLQGMMGPIRVNGVDYHPAAAMPGLKHNADIKDADLADVATFVRHAWGNRKGALAPRTVAKVRAELGDRETVFSSEELESEYP